MFNANFWVFDFFYLMFDMMGSVWSSLSNIVLAGVSFTQVIISFIVLTLVLSAFFGGKNRV